ncbi:MAG: hypothetical protein HQM14_12280 [SAR324 cluster bacterium]|nr:hypothetical protein [SAR324 cluster bacterium]
MYIETIEADAQKVIEHEVEKEENYLNLWGYLRRRYPRMDLNNKRFLELIQMKAHLEGTREIRNYGFELAGVRKR